MVAVNRIGLLRLTAFDCLLLMAVVWVVGLQLMVFFACFVCGILPPLTGYFIMCKSAYFGRIDKFVGVGGVLAQVADE